MSLRAVARINLAAIERNIVRLRSELGPGTRLCAVVKGDGYGHGAVPVARAALAAGARQLAVATAGEAAELRGAGVEATLLVLGALGPDELRDAVSAGAEVVAWTPEFVAELTHVARGGTATVGVHVKLDTGMGRLGTREERQAMEVAEQVAAAGPALQLVGAMTHFATADADKAFLEEQLTRFDPFVATLRGRWPELVVHAANSAATLNEPRSHFDLVRCGIAIYGCDPMNEDPYRQRLEPALELSSYVAALKRARPGESVGYGRTFIADTETWIATVPIGYADGVRRALGNSCDVLVGGQRYPLVGAVSMDNITLALGPDTAIALGDEVKLIGEAGGERVNAEEVARRIGTINYEVVCGISGRVTRIYHRDGVPA